MVKCSCCNKHIKKFFNKKNRLCQSCYRKKNKKIEQCDECNCYGTVAIRLESGGAVCSRCYNKNHRPKHICSECGKLGHINKISGDKLICSKCYKSKNKKCFQCGKVTKVHKVDNGRPVCVKCYMKSYRVEKKCIMCGKSSKIQGFGMCRKCYKKHRYSNDENYRTRELLRSRVYEAIKKNNKRPNNYNINYQAISDKLGPNPGKKGEYHIDHILPLSAFDLSNPKEIEKAFAPENHQWLKKEENMSKSNKHSVKKLERYLTDLVCQNCGSKIPYKIEEKDKIHYLSGRKFCTKCSPLGGKNTRSYIIELEEDEAFCVRCQKIKNKDDFYIRKNSGRPFSYCVECQNKVKILKLEEKLERIIEERGGVCQDCNIPYPTPVYEFYSDNGVYQLSKTKNMSLERIKEELKDYIMLCRNCSAMRQWLRG